MEKREGCDNCCGRNEGHLDICCDLVLDEIWERLASSLVVSTAITEVSRPPAARELYLFFETMSKVEKRFSRSGLVSGVKLASHPCSFQVVESKLSGGAVF